MVFIPSLINFHSPFDYLGDKDALLHVAVGSFSVFEEENRLENEREECRITETNLMRIALNSCGCRVEGNAQYTRNLFVGAMLRACIVITKGRRVAGCRQLIGKYIMLWQRSIKCVHSLRRHS